MGPDCVGNEWSFGTEGSTVAAIASGFELRVMYMRAGDKQSRDCMHLFLLSTTSALPPALL